MCYAVTQDQDHALRCNPSDCKISSRSQHSAIQVQGTTDCKLKGLLLHPTLQVQHQYKGNQLGKYPSNPSFFKQITHYTWHNTPKTLSNQSNPCNAWGTYASRRAPAFISKGLVLHAKHLLKPTLRGYQLLKPIDRSSKKSQLHYIFVHSIYLYFQLLPKSMTGTTKPNTRHHSSNHTTEVVMEEVTPPSKRTSPSTSKPSHKKSKSSTTISLYRDPSQMEF